MSGIYYRTFFSMGRINVIKPAIQDKPATFSSIVSKGSLTVDGTVTISGSLTLSGSEDLVVNTITASGDISASGDIFTNTGSIRHITNIDEIRKDADTFIKFEDSKLTLNSFGTTANSILEIGSLAGDEAFVVKADNVRFNSYGNNPFIHCLHSINSTKFFQNITSSGVFSSSNEIIGNALTISSNEINFTNLPTSDPGVVGRLYRDGATVKISI